MIGVEVSRAFGMPGGQHAVFDGTDAIDAPLIVGDGLGELALDGRLRVEAVDDLLREGAVSGHVFGGEHDDARSEAVAQGVQAGAGAALRNRTVGCRPGIRRLRSGVRRFGVPAGLAFNLSKTVGCIFCG